MLSFVQLDKPHIDIELYGTDTNIAPIDKVHIMDEDSFEQFTLEWLFGCKKSKYSSIKRIGGAGDKGRDVVGYYSDGTVDYYQCKHYNTGLAPTNYYLELGKLCYYTYKKEIPIPKEYFIIASNDVGSSLQDLIDKPSDLLTSLIKNWDTYCKTKITKTKEVPLDKSFLDYIKSFDFTIIKTYPIAQVVDEYLDTIYGNIRFGGRRLSLPTTLTPTDTVESEEMPYISALLEAYSDELNIKIDTIKSLEAYDELTTQYDADLKRLNFIVDGEANLNASFSTHCPFCDGEVVVKKNQNYIDAAKSDYKKIKLQAKDLESASKELRSEKLSLEQEIGTLMAKKKSIEELIEKELKPQVFNLKEKLSAYKDAIGCQKEIDILKKLSEQKTADMIENDTDEESELKFKVKEHLDYSFINELSNGIKSFLENCNYDNLLSVIFDKADMDIVINGKKKSSNGKGYNAYFNSVVAIVLSRYMESKAKYSPDFLVLDSPILSLKEKEAKKPSETMRNTLFENIVDNQKGIQTIVIENEIPEINYKDANIIHFTKEKNNGRYGFLLDVAD